MNYKQRAIAINLQILDGLGDPVDTIADMLSAVERETLERAAMIIEDDCREDHKISGPSCGFEPEDMFAWRSALKLRKLATIQVTSSLSVSDEARTTGVVSHPQAGTGVASEVAPGPSSTSRACSTCGKVENPVCSNSFHLPAYQSALQAQTVSDSPHIVRMLKYVLQEAQFFVARPELRNNQDAAKALMGHLAEAVEALSDVAPTDHEADLNEAEGRGYIRGVKAAAQAPAAYADAWQELASIAGCTDPEELSEAERADRYDTIWFTANRYFKDRAAQARPVGDK